MRDMAGAMVDGAGYWFADWSSGRGRPGVGFFTDPSILRTVEQARQIHEQAMEQPRTGAAEIAVFTDWRTMAYHDLYRSAPVYDNLIPRTLWEGMGKIGAPYDSYMLDDLGEQSVQEGYKLYIFLSAFFLRPEDRERIEALKRDGKTLLFFYAPGYLSREAGLSSEGVSAVTGMTVAAKGGKELMEYSLLPGEHPVIRGLQPDTTFSLQPFGYALSRELHPPELGPVFHVNDPEATALAAYPDGRTALAARDFGDWKSVYCAAPFMDTALLRGVARFAGVHLYCEQDVVLKADGRMLMLHAGPDSPHSLTISLPGKRDVVDAVSGAEVARATDRFDIELGRRDTRVLWLR